MMTFLFDSTVNPNYLVFLRCTTGFILALSFLVLWPDFQQLYGHDGFVDPELLALKQSNSFFTIYDLQDYLKRYSNFSEQCVHQALFIGYTSLCVFLMLGLFTRISSLLLLFLHDALFIAVNQFAYGFDYFCTIALFYCLAFPTNHYKSLDQILFNLKPSRWATPCLRILQIHVSLVYFFSGLDKLLGHTWRNGQALWKTMHLPYFKPAFIEQFNALSAYPWIWVGAGWLVILIELLYPVFIWVPKTRSLQMWLIITLHLQIAFFLELYLFSAMMVALNMSAFYYDLPQSPRDKATLHSLRVRKILLKATLRGKRKTKQTGIKRNNRNHESATQ